MLYKNYKPEELVWLKDKFKFLGRIESYIKQDISPKGYKSLAKRSPIFLSTLLIFTTVSILSLYMYHISNSLIFLFPVISMLIPYLVYLSILNKLKNMNVFVLISKINNNNILNGASSVLQEQIFSNKSIFEDIILWRIQQGSKYKTQMEDLLKFSTWTDIKLMKKSCLTLAGLMSSIQKIIKKNSRNLEIAIKKGVIGSVSSGDNNVDKNTFNNLPKPSIKPLFNQQSNINNPQELISGNFEKAREVKTQGLFQAPNKPLFGQKE